MMKKPAHGNEEKDDGKVDALPRGPDARLVDVLKNWIAL